VMVCYDGITLPCLDVCLACCTECNLSLLMCQCRQDWAIFRDVSLVSTLAIKSTNPSPRRFCRCTPLCLCRRSFHHAGVLIPTLETCCSQLLAAAGQGPFSPSREALLMTCCRTVLEVMSCGSYMGKGASSGSEERVRTYF
jgi:hypothetical protein